MTRAQEAEDNFVLRREMSSLKKGETEVREELAKTKEELDLLKAKVGERGLFVCLFFQESDCLTD